MKRLLADSGIVRNRLKIAAAIQNAKAFLDGSKAVRGADSYLWSFVGGKPKQNRWHRMAQVPARTPESDAMSRDLSRRGLQYSWFDHLLRADAGYRNGERSLGFLCATRTTRRT